MINRIKKSLGKQCTYLSFSTDKALNVDGSWEEVYCLKANMKNDNGGKDTIYLALDKKPSELREEDYKQIFYTLNSRIYENEKRD